MNYCSLLLFAPLYAASLAYAILTVPPDADAPLAMLQHSAALSTLAQSQEAQTQQPFPQGGFPNGAMQGFQPNGGAQGFGGQGPMAAGQAMGMPPPQGQFFAQGQPPPQEQMAQPFGAQLNQPFPPQGQFPPGQEQQAQPAMMQPGQSPLGSFMQPQQFQGQAAPMQPSFSAQPCDSATEVNFNGHCYYLDGSGGRCDMGYEIAPQWVLNEIAEKYSGKTYKHQPSGNCCIAHKDQEEEGQDFGFLWSCGQANAIFKSTDIARGGKGCTDAHFQNPDQLTFCASIDAHPDAGPQGNAFQPPSPQDMSGAGMPPGSFQQAAPQANQDMGTQPNPLQPFASQGMPEANVQPNGFQPAAPQGIPEANVQPNSFQPAAPQGIPEANVQPNSFQPAAPQGNMDLGAPANSFQPPAQQGGAFQPPAQQGGADAGVQPNPFQVAPQGNPQAGGQFSAFPPPALQGGAPLGFMPQPQGLAMVEIQRACDTNTEVLHEGSCYYLDGSGGLCDQGYELAPQAVLQSIGAMFGGKTYKHSVSNNCCVAHKNQDFEGQGFGMQFSCDKPTSAFKENDVVFGGRGCRNALSRLDKQLTLCVSSAPTRSADGASQANSAFSASQTSSAFGAGPSDSAFGGAPSNSAFGAFPNAAYGTAPSNSAFVASPSNPSFGGAPSNSAFGVSPSTSLFGVPQNSYAPSNDCYMAGNDVESRDAFCGSGRVCARKGADGRDFGDCEGAYCCSQIPEGMLQQFSTDCHKAAEDQTTRDKSCAAGLLCAKQGEDGREFGDCSGVHCCSKVPTELPAYSKDCFAAGADTPARDAACAAGLVCARPGFDDRDYGDCPDDHCCSQRITLPARSKCYGAGDSLAARDAACEGNLVCARSGFDDREFGDCDGTHCCSQEPKDAQAAAPAVVMQQGYGTAAFYSQGVAQQQPNMQFPSGNPYGAQQQQYPFSNQQMPQVQQSSPFVNPQMAQGQQPAAFGNLQAQQPQQSTSGVDQQVAQAQQQSPFVNVPAAQTQQPSQVANPQMQQAQQAVPYANSQMQGQQPSPFANPQAAAYGAGGGFGAPPQNLFQR